MPRGIGLHFNTVTLTGFPLLIASIWRKAFLLFLITEATVYTVRKETNKALAGGFHPSCNQTGFN